MSAWLLWAVLRLGGFWRALWPHFPSLPLERACKSRSYKGFNYSVSSLYNILYICSYYTFILVLHLACIMVWFYFIFLRSFPLWEITTTVFVVMNICTFLGSLAFHVSSINYLDMHLFANWKKKSKIRLLPATLLQVNEPLRNYRSSLHS